MNSDASDPPVSNLVDKFASAAGAVHSELSTLGREAFRRWRPFDETTHAPHLDAAVSDATSAVRELSHAMKAFLNEGINKLSELVVPVRSLISREALTCTQDDSLAQAARVLWEHDCGALIVTDTEKHPIGMLTDRDVCMAAYTRGLPLHAMNVRVAMSTEVHAIDVHAPVVALA